MGPARQPARGQPDADGAIAHEVKVTMIADGAQDFGKFVASRSHALLQLAVLLNAGDRYAAEDALHHALVKVGDRWHRVEEPEVYVRQVLYRQQVRPWRLRRPRRELTADASPEHRVPDRPTAERRMVMRHALSQLTGRQRTVLVMRYFEDLPEAEIARLLGCSIDAVRTTTCRSLARLRQVTPSLFSSQSSSTQPSR